MKRIDQFVHTLSYGDAISGESLTIRRILREAGFESDIYVVNRDYRYEEVALNYESYLAPAGAGLILHYSIASPLNDLFLLNTNQRRAVIYHNLTPEKWFYSYNARVVGDLRRARAGLREVVEAADLVLGDSSFNLEELSSFSVREKRVLPLPFDTEKWKVNANDGIRRSIRGIEGRNILTVGRIAPNKCLEDVIKAFYFYHHKINRKSRLWIVGSDTDTEIYSFELHELVEHLSLRKAVEFVGLVSDDELKAFYENSDLYLCMSEHEGFCVPLIEAMHFSLPIIALDACAIRETLGSAGILIPEKEPHVVAELMNLILSDSELRQLLKRASREELARFSLDSFRENLFTNLIDPLKREKHDGARAENRA